MRTTSWPPAQTTTSTAPKVGPWRGPDVGPLLMQAWRGVAAVLLDGEWHDRDELVDAGLATSIVLDETVRGQLNEAWQYGVVERQGGRPRTKAVQYRATEFGRWCRPELRA